MLALLPAGLAVLERTIYDRHGPPPSEIEFVCLFNLVPHVLLPLTALLYGTGIRFGAVITVTINGKTFTPAYAGAQGTYAGLDQINVLLPASLAGSGAVSVTVTVDGQVSNAGTLAFQ